MYDGRIPGVRWKDPQCTETYSNWSESGWFRETYDGSTFHVDLIQNKVIEFDENVSGLLRPLGFKCCGSFIITINFFY